METVRRKKSILRRNITMIAVKLTFWGMCDEAASFYARVFQGKLLEKSLFEENSGKFFEGLSEETKMLVYSATLLVPDKNGDFYIKMGDAPALAFSEVVEKGGCRDHAIFDVELESVPKVEQIYKAFMEDGARCNIPLCIKDDYERYGSFIDRFGVCWNVYSLAAWEWQDQG